MSEESRDDLDFGEETGPRPDRFEGERLANRYLLEKLLDRGGFGGVYRGVDVRFDSQVAIKLLTPPFSDNEFRREAKLARRFRHPNVVEVYDYGIDRGLAYIVMEFLKGDRVDQLLKRYDRLFPLELLDKFVYEISSALQNAHEQQLVHRDLKPQNVMLIDEGKPTERFMLLDFGIAAQTDATNTMRNASRDSAFTPSYGAPERFTGDEVDHRTDVYSFGTILYELMTGCLPFNEERLLLLMQAVQSKSPPQFAEVAPHAAGADQLEALIMRCLAKEPVDRPQTMEEVREEYFIARQSQINNPVDRARFVDLWKRDFSSSATTEPSFGAGDTAPTIDAPDTDILQRSRSETSQPGDTDRWASEQQLSAAQQELDRTVTTHRRRMWTTVIAATCVTAAAVFVFSPSPTDAPPAPEAPIWLPSADFQPVEEAAVAAQEYNGYRLYEKIERVIPGEDGEETRVVFVLIDGRAAARRPDVPHVNPFYIMENKVWNGLYHLFAEENPKSVARDEEGGPAVYTEGAMVDGELLGADEPLLPVFNVTAAEAHRCASLLDGRLPTVAEWNTAAGYYDWKSRPPDEREELAGPFRGDWLAQGADKPQIAIDGKRPLKVGTAKDDVSPYGCRDMAGNGEELSCELEGPRVGFVPVAEPNNFTFVRMRGKSYGDTVPFFYRDFETSSVQGYLESSPFVGFRVVIEIN